MGTDNRDDNDNVYLSDEEALALEEIKEHPAKLAVEETLLPSLKGDAAIHGRELAEKCGSYNLYSATEAVSLMLRRYLLRERYLRAILLGRNGDALAYGRGEQVVITTKQLAIEVARFTDLWENDKAIDSELQPAAETFAMVRWMWEAMQYQPCLLRHFIATATDNPDCFLLTEIPSQDRVEDPRQRWSCKK